MSPVEYTFIDIGGIRIEEPVTALTDLLTATVCFIAFFQLHKLKIDHKAFSFFKYYFLFMALGTTCAAFLSHAILYWSGYNWKMLGWTFSAIGIFHIENSALLYFQEETDSKRLNWLSFAFKVQLIVFLLCLSYTPTRLFEVVQINSSLGIVGITFPLFAYLFFKTRKQSYKKIVIAFCMSIVTGLVFNAEITFHKYFNYHDFAHVLMAFSSFLLFMAGLELAKMQSQKT
ncbi:MAG: hypothetical protein AB8G11_13615 [Saprospiraceae bacterium]